MTIQENKGKLWLFGIVIALALAASALPEWTVWIFALIALALLTWIFAENWASRFSWIQKLSEFIEGPFQRGLSRSAQVELVNNLRQFHSSVDAVHRDGGHDRSLIVTAEHASEAVANWLENNLGALTSEEFRTAVPVNHVRSGQTHGTADRVQRLEGQVNALRVIVSRHG